MSHYYFFFFLALKFSYIIVTVNNLKVFFAKFYSQLNTTQIKLSSRLNFLKFSAIVKYFRLENAKASNGKTFTRLMKHIRKTPIIWSAFPLTQ